MASAAAARSCAAVSASALVAGGASAAAAFASLARVSACFFARDKPCASEEKVVMMVVVVVRRRPFSRHFKFQKDQLPFSTPPLSGGLDLLTNMYHLSRRRAPPPALECPGGCSATAQVVHSYQGNIKVPRALSRARRGGREARRLSCQSGPQLEGHLARGSPPRCPRRRRGRSF